MRTNDLNRTPVAGLHAARWGLLAVLGWIASAHAQSAPADEKLDTLLVKQQQLLEGQARLEGELLPRDPFPNGAVGFAFNLPLAVASSATETRILSASLIWFPPRSQMEVVLPVWIRSSSSDTDFRAILVDVQGRYYLNPRRSGLYWLAGLRQAWLSGRKDYDYDINSGSDYGLPADVSKTGVYGGMGFRANSKRFYWNCNLAFGRYFGGDSVQLQDDGMLGEDYLLDVELFKFGLIF